MTLLDEETLQLVLQGKDLRLQLAILIAGDGAGDNWTRDTTRSP